MDNFNGKVVKLFSLNNYIKKLGLNKAELYRSMVSDSGPDNGQPAVNEATVGRILKSGSGVVAEDENGTAFLLISKTKKIKINS